MSKHTRTTQLRLEHICDMMRRLEFKRGETFKQLAASWGISESRVKALTSEASRIVLAEVTDPERVKPDLCAALAEAVKRAMAEGEFNAVAQLARVYAEILGIKAPAQTHVTVAPGEATPERARELVSRGFGSGAMPAEKKDQPS